MFWKWSLLLVVNNDVWEGLTVGTCEGVWEIRRAWIVGMMAEVEVLHTAGMEVIQEPIREQTGKFG